MVSSPPSHLGRFVIESVLGEGGSAIVYAARDGSRAVALKVLHPGQYADEKQVDRFLEEAERLRRVEHPSLVRVLGAGTLPGGRPFIVMPRLVGRPLSVHLEERGPIPLTEALHLFESLAGAVVALHAHGLLHRDIKPDNVFVSDADEDAQAGHTPSTSTRRLILLDLGIARDHVADPSTTTRAGFMRGTPAYMSPERLFGQQASTRSDLYELALTLFLMLTGHLPWEASDPAGRISPSLRTGDDARVPKAIADCFWIALSADVSKRFHSVTDLVDALRAAAPDAPTTRSAADRSVFANSIPALPLIAAHPTPNRGNQELANPYAKTARHPIHGPRSIVPWVGAAGLVGLLTAGAVYALPKLTTPRLEQVGFESEVTNSNVISPVPPEPNPSHTALVEPAPSVSTEPVLSASASALASMSAIAPQRSAASSVPIKEGVLPAAQIEGAVRARMGGMQACVAGEAEHPAFVGGRVVMNFWIGLDGSVTKASGRGENLPPAVTDCVIAQLRTIRFPQPVGGPVNVIFPIRFTPPKRP